MTDPQEVGQQAVRAIAGALSLIALSSLANTVLLLCILLVVIAK